jgi:DUF4097 and DUF4098 domain-containing protein YvlB
MLNDSKANKIFMLALIVAIALFLAFRPTGNGERSRETFSLDGTDSLKIETIDTDISLEIADRATQGSVSFGTSSGRTLDIDRDGSAVTVTVKPDSSRWALFSGGRSSRLVVTVPAGYLDELEVSTTSGDIDLMQDLAMDRIAVSSTSGDIDGQNLHATESLSVSSVSGDIRCFSVDSDGKTSATTTSGDIDINEIGGQTVQLRTTSADIFTSVHVANDGKATVSSASGDVTLQFGTPGNLTIEAKTVSGNIGVNGEYREEGTTFSETLGNGNALVAVSSISGDIELRY